MSFGDHSNFVIQDTPVWAAAGVVPPPKLNDGAPVEAGACPGVVPNDTFPAG